MVRTNLKVFRVNRGLSMRSLGDLTEIPFSYIGSFEKGRMNPTPDEIERLCKALKVSFEDLYPDPDVQKVLLGRAS